MDAKMNQAKRLLRLFAKTDSIDRNTETVTAWATIFDIKEENSVRKATLVAAYLGHMHDQLVRIEDQMQKKAIAPNAYANNLREIEHALSPGYLFQPWATVTRFLKPEHIAVLTLCAELIPAEDAELSAELMQSIRDSLAELKTFSTDESVPTHLRETLQAHINLISEAISLYPILGASALADARKNALFDLIDRRDEFAGYKDQPATSRLLGIWETITKAYEIAVKAGDVAQLGQKAAEVLTQFLLK